MIQETTAEILHAWDSFYVIVGSSAAALTGLSFVVIALVSEKRQAGSQGDVAAFGTPTVFHLTMALFVSVVLSAPWRTLASPGLVLGVFGIAGLGYEMITTIRAFRSTGYQPVFEDWVFHVVLPLIAYVLVLLSAVLLPRDPTHALFAIGTGSVILLLVGIHNSWDTVTYVAALK